MLHHAKPRKAERSNSKRAFCASASQGGDQPRNSHSNDVTDVLAAGAGSTDVPCTHDELNALNALDEPTPDAPDVLAADSSADSATAERRLNRMKPLCILATILVIAAVSLWWCVQKQGMFVDEVYSYGLANSDHLPFLVETYDDGIVDHVLTREDFEAYVSVTEADAFAYDSVYYNQALDVHPPLFYFLLHTVSSLFPGTFTKWTGLGLNLVLFALTLIALYHLVNTVTRGRWRIALLACLLYATSDAGLSTLLMVRMYMLLTLLSVSLALVVAKIVSVTSEVGSTSEVGATSEVGSTSEMGATGAWSRGRRATDDLATDDLATGKRVTGANAEMGATGAWSRGRRATDAAFWLLSLLAGFIIFLGMLTQYFFAVYAFFLCAACAIALLVGNRGPRRVRAAVFAVFAFVGVGAMVAVFPYWDVQLHSQDTVSLDTVAGNAAAGIASYAGRIVEMVVNLALDIPAVSLLLVVSLIVLVVVAVWSRTGGGPRVTAGSRTGGGPRVATWSRTGGVLRGFPSNALIVCVPAVVAFLVISIIAPYVVVRYTFQIVPILVVLVCVLWMQASDALLAGQVAGQASRQQQSAGQASRQQQSAGQAAGQVDLYNADAQQQVAGQNALRQAIEQQDAPRMRQATGRRRFVAGTWVLVVACALVLSVVKQPSFVQLEYADIHATVGQNEQASCVYLTSNGKRAQITSDVEFLMRFDEVYVAEDVESDALQNYLAAREPESLFLFVPVTMEEAAVDESVRVLMDECGLTRKTLVATKAYTSIYLLQR